MISEPKIYVNTFDKLDWLAFVKADDVVWLAKESEFATVCLRYDRGDDPAKIGLLAIQRQTRKIEIWFVSSSGFGLDGSRLMFPTSANLLGSRLAQEATSREIIDETDRALIRQIQSIIDEDNAILDAMVEVTPIQALGDRKLVL